MSDSIAQLLAQRSDQYYPLDILAGDTFKLDLVFTESDGTPIDLTGATYLFNITVGAFSGAYTTGPQVVVDADPTTGHVTLELAYTVTATMVANTGTYYFQVLLADGDKTTLLNGDVHVRFNS